MEKQCIGEEGNVPDRGLDYNYSDENIECSREEKTIYWYRAPLAVVWFAA